MKRNRRLLAIFAVLGLVIAACGNGDAEETTTTAAPSDTTVPDETTTTEAPDDTTTTEAVAMDVLVGMAFDIGGRGDLSFNDSAAEGLDRAIAEFGIESEELEPTGGGEDRDENLQLLADFGSDLVIAVGFAFTDGVASVAPLFPDVNFGLVDAVVEEPNVASLLFAEEQGSALVGCVAGLMTETGTVGFIGGVNIDLIHKFEAGFNFGAEYCNPDVTIQGRYLTEPPDFSGFADSALGREAAVALFDAGADIIYHAAGGAGAGLFEEAAARRAGGDDGIWAIGVDSDQYFTVPTELQDVVLTSMLKRVDVAVYETIRSVVDGTFAGGIHRFDLAAEGVGYSTSGDFIPADVITEVEALREAIIAGDVEVPETP